MKFIAEANADCGCETAGFQKKSMAATDCPGFFRQGNPPDIGRIAGIPQGLAQAGAGSLPHDAVGEAEIALVDVDGYGGDEGETLGSLPAGNFMSAR
jgi:hypothetical protein